MDYKVMDDGVNVMVIYGPGLRSEAGDYNCFLNVIILVGIGKYAFICCFLLSFLSLSIVFFHGKIFLGPKILTLSGIQSLWHLNSALCIAILIFLFSTTNFCFIFHMVVLALSWCS